MRAVIAYIIVSLLWSPCPKLYQRLRSSKFGESLKRKEFFRKLGSLLQPQQEDNLSDLSEDTTAQQILDRAR
jgi:hypothetical protein